MGATDASLNPAGVVTTKVRIPDVPSLGLDRLDARLEAVWSHRLGLVVAPAGSGKTSLLARFAARAPGPTGWYRAEGWDSTERALVRHLEAALTPALPGLDRHWQSIGDVANALAGWTGERVLLVVDDLHTLEGTAAEGALERLVEYAPPALTVLAATRTPPHFNLPRLRVSGGLLELSGDDLRFRSWEVERLFRDFYEQPLPPEDLARLARRTEGWAAGLQLFHLATAGRPPEERRRLLGELGPSSRLARELRDYLARNVIEQLPPNLRGFLVETSVLGKLTAEVCNRLLDRSDSGEILESLERRRLFTHRLSEDGCYRYHEILRSHLQGVLLEQVGAAALRERFRRAGKLLIEADALAEAVEASCRGEDWDLVSRLLGRNGRDMAEASSVWLDALPATVVANDPWLLLASARRLRAEGRLRDAIERYRQAEASFGRSDAGSTCRDERVALEPWVEGLSAIRGERRQPFSVLRAGIARDPLLAGVEAERLGSAEGEVAAGLAALLAGHVSRARRDLLHAEERGDLGRQTQLAATLGAGLAGLLMGQRHAPAEVEGMVAAAEEAGAEWLARVGRAALALSGTAEAGREARALAEACHRLGDRWGEALAILFTAWGAARSGQPIGDLDPVLPLLRTLEAGALEAWARGLGALEAAREGRPEATDIASAAEASARASGVAAASLLANVALAIAASTSRERDEYRVVAEVIASDTGLLAPAIGVVAAVDAVLPGPRNGEMAVEGGAGDRELRADRPAATLRLLGGFELRLADEVVDLSGIRPRARALLRMLALNAGTAVHHETIEAALWPDADAEAAARNLHVAIAAVRRALEPTATRGSFQILRREGDAYRLVLPAGGEIDVLRFQQAVAAGRTALAQRDEARAEAAFARALDLYRGELLPEDGPAEWVTDDREHHRQAAAEVAQALAEILLARGDAAAAARVATAGLQVERYHDPLWRILIQARDQAGDKGAASRARSCYGRMLAELGVTAATTA